MTAMEGQSLRADLRLHSRWSDGSLPIPALLELAKRLGLGCVAITDHDTLAGQAQAAAAAQDLGIHLIVWLEISAFDPDTGRKVHILGYGIRDARIERSENGKPEKEQNKRTNLPKIRKTSPDSPRTVHGKTPLTRARV